MSFAYFDNAATTYIKPQEMHNFMHEFYSANSVNVGRGNHSLLQSSSKMVKDTRKLLLEIFSANSNYETIFTPTATEAINVILQGQHWVEGDVVYISPFEHNAVFRTIKHLEKKYNLIIEVLRYNTETYELDFDAIAMQFAIKKPKFVVTSHVSNVCGIVQDINKLGILSKKHNAKVMFDCAQSAGLLETDIIQCQADYMVFAGHKTLYGPFGCSGFICKKDSAPLPLIYGGTGIDSASIDMPNELPTRYEAGSINIMAIAGLYKSLQWLKEIGKEEIIRKEKENYLKLYDLIKSHDNIKIVGESKNSTSIISCVFDDYSPDNIGNIMSENGVIVRTGLHCAPIAHKTLGTFPEGTVRFSVSWFNNDEDFKALDRALKYIEENS